MNAPRLLGFTQNRLAWVILGAALALSAFVRWRLSEFPLERDEGEYAYAGQLILQGIPPYRLAYNMKLPGTYLAYAGLMAIFGQTAAGVHLGLLAVGLASIGLLFLLTRDLFNGLTGAVAAMFFAVLSLSPSVLGLAAHATHFVAFFGLAGVWVLWRALRSDRVWLFLPAGVLLGLAFVMKQHGVFLPCFGGLAALLSGVKRRPFLSPRHLVTCLLYAVGAVLPLAAICGWLWLAGTFDKFWFWTFQYARTYVVQVPWELVLPCFWNQTTMAIGRNWPIWALALVGAVSLARSRGVPGRRAFIFAFLGFSFLCVCPGFYFRVHYFIVFIPCVAILASVGCVALVGAAARRATAESGGAGSHAPSAGRRGKRQQAKPGAAVGHWDVVARRALVGVAILISLAAAVFPVWQQRSVYFVLSMETACRKVYGFNPFIQCRVIADYLKTHSSPDDRVAVFGSEPELFFYAGRKSATGYIYMYPLMEPHALARKMQNEMIDEVEAAKPEFLVSVSVPTSWQELPGADRHILNWVNRYAVTDHYPVGLIDILPNEETEYKWDAEAAGAQPRSNSHIWVMRRKR